jgi:hypothetical protein
VKLGNRLVGDLVMSGGGYEIQVSDYFLHFRKGYRGIVGQGGVVVFDKVRWQRGWTGCLWWEEGVPEDVTFSLKIGCAIEGGVTLGTVSAVRRGFRSFGFRS